MNTQSASGAPPDEAALMPASATDETAEPIVIKVPGGENPALDRFWSAVRRLPRYILLGTNLARDGRVPKRSKATLGLGGAYTVSPIDLVPGIIPVVGQLDDLAVLLLTLRRVLRTASPEVRDEHLRRAGLTMDDLDDDLRAVRDTGLWLARSGAKTAGRLAAKGGRRLKLLAASLANGR